MVAQKQTVNYIKGNGYIIFMRASQSRSDLKTNYFNFRSFFGDFCLKCLE